MKLLVIDTETTGLDVPESKLIEIGACLYHVESKTIIGTVQTLIHAAENPVEHINHISVRAMEAAKDQEKVYIELLKNMAKNCDYIVAHNAKFDKYFIDRDIGSLDKQWICSKNDLKFPKAGKSSRLGHLAYDHDIPVINAHRGLTDVNILIDLLNVLSEDELKGQIDEAAGEQFEYEALVSFDNRNLAKDEGFSWDGTRKVWTKKMTETKAAKIEKFKVRKA